MSSLRSKAAQRSASLATVAFYGPNDRTRSKVVVTLLRGSKMLAMKRWVASDLMSNAAIWNQIFEFMAPYRPREVAETVGVLGCPHEEGQDYQGQVCPFCPFWAGVDRWQTGQPMPYDYRSWLAMARERGADPSTF